MTAPRYTYATTRGMLLWHAVNLSEPRAFDTPALCGLVPTHAWTAYADAVPGGQAACEECERRKEGAGSE